MPLNFMPLPSRERRNKSLPAARALARFLYRTLSLLDFYKIHDSIQICSEEAIPLFPAFLQLWRRKRLSRETNSKSQRLSLLEGLLYRSAVL